MIFRRVAIALLDLPEAVVVPGQDVVRIGLQSALIPDLGLLVVAELAIGVADEIGYIGIIIVPERLELIDRSSVVMPIVDRVVGRTVALPEGGIVEERTLVGSLDPGMRRLGVRAVWIGRRRAGRGGVTAERILAAAAPTSAAATAAPGSGPEAG